MKVFDVESEEQKSQRLTPAIGSQEWAEVEHDFESGIAAFQPGQKTRLHIHTNDQLIYVIDGKGIIGTETEQHLATPGKVFVTPKNQKHFQAASDDMHFTFLFVQRFPNETKIWDEYVPITVI